MQNIELLAPAGDMDTLQVAINNGANAVYLGMQNFNARQKAKNFDASNIKEAVDYAHLFGAKVYLTINTLVKNSEIDTLIDTVKSAVEAGVDGYLVQDLGVAYILRECFPNIVLHASTQMGIHNLRGAKVAERIGIQRIVLSRETKLDDIIAIHQNTNLEIEYFVQGALCVAFSGNCYFSAFENNDSGNRGMCKQLCRMRYSAGTVKDEYLLSPADLCLIKNLKKLIDAGVVSFKIEGRLRRAGYVAQAVSSYRKALDTLCNNDNFNIDDEIFKLRKVFSRGEFNYNAYLDNGVPSGIINKKVQNHLGIKIGKVRSIEPFKTLSRVVINSTHSLHEGDGLKFVDNERQVVSLGVGNVDNLGDNNYAIYTKHQLQVGYDVYLILDYEAEQELIDTQRHIPVGVTINASVGRPLSCTLVASDVSIDYVTDFICEKAKTVPTTAQELANQFGKMGETHFVAKNINVISDNVFVPKSVINNMRRCALEQLKAQILDKNNAQKNVKFIQDKLPNLLDLCNELKQNKRTIYERVLVVDERFDTSVITKFGKNSLLCLAPSKYNVDTVGEWLGKVGTNIDVAINLPIVANGKDLQVLDEILQKYPSLKIVANNLYGLDYVTQGKTVLFGTGLNVFNNYTVYHLSKLGVNNGVVSIEQCLDDIVLTPNNFVYTIGQFAIMTFCHCPYQTVSGRDCTKCAFDNKLALVDNSKVAMPVRRYIISQCYFELLNSKIINNIGWHKYSCWIDVRNLYDYIDEIASALNANKKVKIFPIETIGKIQKSVN